MDNVNNTEGFKATFDSLVQEGRNIFLEYPLLKNIFMGMLIFFAIILAGKIIKNFLRIRKNFKRKANYKKSARAWKNAPEVTYEADIYHKETNGLKKKGSRENYIYVRFADGLEKVYKIETPLYKSVKIGTNLITIKGNSWVTKTRRV